MRSLRCPVLFLVALHVRATAQTVPPSDSFTVSFWRGSQAAYARYPFVRERITLMDGRVVLDDSIPPECIPIDPAGRALVTPDQFVHAIDSMTAWRRLIRLGEDSLGEVQIRGAILAFEQDVDLAMGDEAMGILERLRQRNPPVFSTQCQGAPRYYVWVAERGKLYHWIPLPVH